MSEGVQTTGAHEGSRLGTMGGAATQKEGGKEVTDAKTGVLKHAQMLCRVVSCHVHASSVTPTQANSHAFRSGTSFAGQHQLQDINQPGHTLPPISAANLQNPHNPQVDPCVQCGRG